MKGKADLHADATPPSDLNPGENKERVFRKTLEIIERPFTPHVTEAQKTFTTEPKTFRIRRGHTIVIRRCKQIMKFLWQMGLRHGALVRKKPIEAAIFYCAGGDYRTIKKYLGFRRLLRKGNALNPPQTLYVQGYLERLHYIGRAKQGNYRLYHEAVPLNYHYVEQLIPPNPPSPNSVNAKVPKQVLCVRSSGVGSDRGEGALAPIQRNKTNKHNTHTNQLSESNRQNNIKNTYGPNMRSLSAEEMAILEAVPKEEPDRGRVRWRGSQ